jgi:CelD/BcsL family acetyltransferase involved in cellulose biosynthesis
MSAEVRVETLESLSGYHDDLGNGLNWSSIFVLPVWLQAWWAIFGEEYELSLHSVWQNGELIGIAPLMRRGEEAFFLGSPDVCDYLDFITVPGKEKEFLQGLLPELKRQKIGRLELYAQRPDSVIFQGLFLSELDLAYRGQFWREDQSYEIILASTWDDYLALLNKKQRHEVRRKMRRLENEALGYRYRIIGEGLALEDYMPDFFDLFQQNPEKAVFLTEKMEQYFRLMIAGTARAGLARFGLLEVDGVMVAAVFFFDYQGRIYLYNSGYLSEYAALSVGLLSKIHCLKDSIAGGKQVFDFLKGQEVYKSRLGGTAIPIYKVKITIT